MSNLNIVYNDEMKSALNNFINDVQSSNNIPWFIVGNALRSTIAWVEKKESDELTRAREELDAEARMQAAQQHSEAVDDALNVVSAEDSDNKEE